MTTVLADYNLGLIVADTGASAGDRQWPGARKVWRSRKALLAFSGEYAEIEQFLQWWRDGAVGKGPKCTGIHALVMTFDGLSLYQGSTQPIRVDTGRDAIGTGGKAAMAAYEALGFRDPRRAVQIACKYDAASRSPLRQYLL